MKHGFESVGCIVEGGCGFLDSLALLEKIEVFKPDFVFEMNRVKSEIKNFPKELIHICWLVDYWERTAKEITGSDILYLFSHTWHKDHKNFQAKLIKTLYPGTDINSYTPTKVSKEKDSTIFLGHMPKPWTTAELQRDVYLDANKSIKFKELVQLVHHFTLHPKSFHDGTISTKKFLLEELHVDDINTYDDRVLHYDIFARLFREGRREGVINKALSSNLKLSLYGSENWKLRENFKPYYKKVLVTPSDINEAFSHHTFLLHDGNMPHFRTFDAMAAGLLILKPNVTGYGIDDEWQFLDFKEGSEVLTFELESNTLTSHTQLSHIQELGREVRHKISQSHTWSHRAQTVLKDVANAKK